MNSVLFKKRTGSSIPEKICKPLPHIPSPIIGDILSYLPLKTVVQSKIVCKEWENLISDPGLAKSHFSKSPQGLFLHCEMSGNVLHFVDLRNPSLRFKLGGDTYVPHNAIVGKFLSTKIKFEKCFITSCNGYLCFCETEPNSRYYICNPITRDYTITPPLSDMGSDISKEHWRSEFGFSPKTGQFKVLRMRLSFKQKAKIFTLGQRDWRSIDIPKDFNPYRKVAFLNGIFHWLSYRDKILSFDVEAETFQEFSFPLDFGLDDDKSTSFNYSLGILDGCISLCRGNHEDGVIEIWILKEYGVTESWVKEFVIDDASKFASRLRVLWIMEDGEKGKNVLLVCNRSTVVTYDTIRGVCSYLKFDGLWESLTVFPHTPTLTPLKDVIIFDENSKLQDEDEDMSPERSVRHKARHLYDIMRQRRPNPYASSSSSSSTKLPSSEVPLSKAEEEILARLDELTYGNVMRNKFCELVKEFRFTGKPGAHPASTGDLSNDPPATTGDLSNDPPATIGDLSNDTPAISSDDDITSDSQMDNVRGWCC